MQDDIQTDKTPIETYYWEKIIEKMYDDNDTEMLQMKIKE